MVPDELQEVIDAMTEFIETEIDPSLDTIAEWRDKLKSHQVLFDNTMTTETMVINASNLIINAGDAKISENVKSSAVMS